MNAYVETNLVLNKMIRLEIPATCFLLSADGETVKLTGKDVKKLKNCKKSFT